ncbi:hypothetical protein P8452_70555 [Trifolium repens]|nr:hypothetical protein P8452_70555 [Trifolium repens]
MLSIVLAKSVYTIHCLLHLFSSSFSIGSQECCTAGINKEPVESVSRFQQNVADQKMQLENGTSMSQSGSKTS